MISINGIGGMKNGSKIIRSVVAATISPKVLSMYTWTGRSGKKAFETKKKIVDLFYLVIRSYDAGYSRTNCLTDLKYKIFKYAYTKLVIRVTLLLCNLSE